MMPTRLRALRKSGRARYDLIGRTSKISYSGSSPAKIKAGDDRNFLTTSMQVATYSDLPPVSESSVESLS
jgi:hypothetical protein